MKNLLLNIIGLTGVLLLTSSCGSSNEVPEKVQTSFENKYPEAANVTWEHDPDGEWEASFTSNGKNQSADFEPDGIWIETEFEIEFSQLPDGVKNAIQSDFLKYEVKKSEVTESEKGMAYELLLKSNESSMEMLFSEKGKIIEKKILGGGAEMASEDKEFTSDFFSDKCTFLTNGKNRYFILEPGFQLILKGSEEDEEIELIITVLNKTKVVNGIETRVVEEKESVNGEMEEISRNYFAFCKETGSIYYFGEDVDMYEDGEITSHSGAWLAEGDNRAGVIMPGTFLLGSRYYQEIAPGIAMDRAQIVSISEQFETPSGNFSGVLKTEETSGLNANEREYKLYAPGIGLIKDENLLLVEHGYVNLESSDR